jgi:uncharacterized YigZ family protein
MSIDSYKTIQRNSKGVYKEKGSKFYAFAFPVHNDDEIQIYRDQIKKEYHDARHHVYAFRLGYKMKHFRASDDGEPSNSSGPPVLGKIKSYELTDILIIVVRYFGGTKLGIPGLIKAYGSAAEDAILQNKIIEKTIMKQLIVKFEYAQMNDVMRIIKDHNLTISKQDFQLSCEISIDIPMSKFEQIKAIFENNHKIDLET